MHSSYLTDGFAFSDSKIISDKLVDLAFMGAMDLLEGHYDTGILPPETPHGWKPKNGRKRAIQIDRPHVSSSKIAKLLESKQLRNFITSVTGFKNPRLQWSQLIIKPSSITNDNIKIQFHQDSSYEQGWGMNSQLATCWVPLTHITPDSSPLVFIKGSHILGPEGCNVSFDQGIKNVREGIWSNFEEVNVTLSKGYASIHNRNIYHASGVNTADTTRVALALHLLGDHYQLENGVEFEGLDSEIYCPHIGA